MISRGAFLSTTGLTAFVILTSIIAIDNSQLAGLFKKTNFQTGTATNLTITQMNHHGTRRYIAHFASATEFKDHSIHFNQLHALTFSQHHQAPWTIVANHGSFSHEHHKVVLWDNVKAWRPAKGKARALRLTTQHITLYPHQHYATSPVRVTITQPGTDNMTTGIGLKAYNQPTQFVHFFSHVYSVYQSQTVPSQKDKLVHIHSQQLTVDGAKSRATYQGNVHATRGTRQLWGDRLVIQETPTHQLHSIITYGHPARTQSIAKPGNPPATGQAETIYYWPDQHLLRYIGHAKLEQSGNIFKGEYFDYNTLTKQMIGPSTNKEQSTILLPPYQQEKLLQHGKSKTPPTRKKSQ